MASWSNFVTIILSAAGITMRFLDSAGSWNTQNYAEVSNTHTDIIP